MITLAINRKINQLLLPELYKNFRLLYRYGQGILGLKADDVILASYPKSGNTWVRFIYAHLISQLYWEGKVIDFKLLDEIMPEVGANNLLEDWNFPEVPRLVKTHNNYWPLYKRNYVILLIRDPKDVMVSYFYFEKKKKNPFAGDFQSFIRSSGYGLDNWFNHYISWKTNADVMLKFEDLKKDDMTVFKNLLQNNLNTTPPVNSVENAVLKSRFRKIREIEDKYGHPKLNNHQSSYKFARKGEVGCWRELFNGSDLEYYNELKEKYKVTLY